MCENVLWIKILIHVISDVVRLATLQSAFPPCQLKRRWGKKNLVQTPASLRSEMLRGQQPEEALPHDSYRVPLPPSCREAAGEHSRREATWSSVHDNSQLRVPDSIAVTPYYSFLVQEKTPLTVSILCSDAYVTRKAEVLQADTQLRRNKTSAYSFIQQGVAYFAQKRF